MKLKHIISIMLTVLIINMLSINIYSTQKKSEDIVKVGVYEYGSYIYTDNYGHIKGYYNDLLKLLAKKSEFQYEYIICNLSDGIKKLEDGDIDIILGVPIASDTSENIIFSRHSLNEEVFGVFSKKDIKLDDLRSFDEVKLGIVEDDYNAKWILKFFESNKVNIKTVFDKNYKSLEKLMEEDKIDLMIDSGHKQSQYKMIYKFTSNEVYIAANKNNKDILDNIDKAFTKINSEDTNKIEKIYDKYFDEEYKINLIKKIIAILISFILSLLVIIFMIIPKTKKEIIKNKIRKRMNNNKYLLQYQPIYNPRNEEIVGFEGLLRLLDEDNKLIPPFKFIPEIEENDMLFDISLWILEKAIKDYDKIKNYKSMADKNFYISINVSLNEIENDLFVKKANQILSKSNIEKGKICLEIIERVKINDLDKINKNINLLKSAGFKIAIDDFGVEYSNLDVLHKLDIDTIKVDKNFVDGIGKDIIRNEVVMFISKIANAAKKAVVLEGVEEIEQDIAIKNIKNTLLYVQGYYYNKPMYIEDIEKI